jgi:hypothetical protein
MVGDFVVLSVTLEFHAAHWLAGLSKPATTESALLGPKPVHSKCTQRLDIQCLLAGCYTSLSVVLADLRQAVVCC